MAGRGIHGFRLPPRKVRVREKYLNITFVLPGFIPSKKNRQIPIIVKKGETINEVSGLIDQCRKGQINFDQLHDLVIGAIQNLRAAIVNSSEYQEWEKGAKELVLQQAATFAETYRKQNLSFPIKQAKVKIYHYWTDNNIRDNSGKAEGIHDLLVSAGILLDDSWQCLTPNEADAELYKGEIIKPLTEVTVIAYN